MTDDIYTINVGVIGKKNVGKSFILNMLQENEIILLEKTTGFKGKICNDSNNNNVRKISCYDY